MALPDRGLMSTTEYITLGKEVEQLLESRAFQMAFDHTEARLVEDWKQEIDPKIRETLWAQVQGLSELLVSLRTYAADAQRDAERYQRSTEQ